MSEQTMWAVKTGFGRIIPETIATLGGRARLLAMLHHTHGRDWPEMMRESGYTVVRVRITEVQDGA